MGLDLLDDEHDLFSPPRQLFIKSTVNVVFCDGRRILERVLVPGDLAERLVDLLHLVLHLEDLLLEL